ncbi:hypothetical protein CSKR_106181 [Clonorchis sinensis]|uniref:Uncharacterized protein n=1 Tax=Clonorchis sinensis TaxID=79923 RepID=A0A3R7CUJ6_CLOSI|nr:hypothetical protein CSKR_106181 [Clonorchis sinensis]
MLGNFYQQARSTTAHANPSQVKQSLRKIEGELRWKTKAKEMKAFAAENSCALYQLIRSTTHRKATVGETKSGKNGSPPSVEGGSRLSLRHPVVPSAIPFEVSTRTEILSGYPSLHMSSPDAEAGSEQQAFGSVSSPSATSEIRIMFQNSRRHFLSWTRWLKWLEREFTDRKVRGSNPTSASRLPLSRFGQPGSIPALMLPSGGMAVRHRKDATAEGI